MKSVTKQQVWNITSVCPYSCLCYPASKSHPFCVALYYHLWPVWPYHVFHIISEGSWFSREKKNL